MLRVLGFTFSFKVNKMSERYWNIQFTIDNYERG